MPGGIKGKRRRNQPLLDSLGRSARAVRIARGWTQEELGRRSGLHRVYIAEVERAMRNPTISFWQGLCDGLGVKLADLIAFAAGDGLSDELERIFRDGQSIDTSHQLGVFYRPRGGSPD